MKLTTVSLIVALNFPVTATAFRFGVEDGLVSQACAKALTAGIECHEYISAMNLNHYQKWVGDVKLADEICSDTCSNSFRSWNDTVTKDCAEEMNAPGFNPSYTTDSLISTVSYYWQGFNETCVKDTQSDRYCQEILEGFSKINYFRHDRPMEELCHPCYGKVLNVMSKSFLWAIADNFIFGSSTKDEYWKGELELVQKKCGDSNSPVTTSDSPTETAIPDTTGPTPDGPTDPGIPSDCSFFQTINNDLYDCWEFIRDWAMTPKQFVEYNPTIKEDCSGIQLGHSYCVEVNNGRPRKKDSPKTTTTEEVEPQPTENEKLDSSQGTLKDAYKVFFEANKQAVLEKARELGQRVLGESYDMGSP